MEGGVVETLSNLVSHSNATIQLNALWGLMVSGGRGREKGGREKGRKLLKLPPEYTIVFNINV